MLVTESGLALLACMKGSKPPLRRAFGIQLQ